MFDRIVSTPSATVASRSSISIPSADAARTSHARIVIETMNGLEIALRGLLFGAGFKLAVTENEVVQAELDDVRLTPSDAGPGPANSPGHAGT